MNTYSLDNVGIVLGTHNDEKASELSLLLQGLPLNLVSAKDLNEVASLEEIGTTHYEMLVIKRAIGHRYLVGLQ